MNTHEKSAVVAPGTDRRFFTGMAVAVAVSVFAGFAPTYYLKGLYGSPVTAFSFPRNPVYVVDPALPDADHADRHQAY